MNQRCLSTTNGEQEYQYLVIGRDQSYFVKCHLSQLICYSRPCVSTWIFWTILPCLSSFCVSSRALSRQSQYWNRYQLYSMVNILPRMTHVRVFTYFNRDLTLMTRIFNLTCSTWFDLSSGIQGSWSYDNWIIIFLRN